MHDTIEGDLRVLPHAEIGGQAFVQILRLGPERERIADPCMRHCKPAKPRVAFWVAPFSDVAKPKVGPVPSWCPLRWNRSWHS